MKKFIPLLTFVLLLFVSCSRTGKDTDGYVDFAVEGETYRLENIEFKIRARPLVGEGEKMKTIARGEKILFEYYLGSSVKEMLRQNKKAQSEKITFSAIWTVDTAEPEQFLDQKTSWGLKDTGLEQLVFIIELPGKWIRSPEGTDHNCWVEIDEVAPKKITGSFGGTFSLTFLGEELDKRLQAGGTEIEKEVEITGGVFAAPYKKLYKYR